MKKISEHIEVYLIQKESLFSILGRISINAIVFLYPLVHILEYPLLYFLYKWLFVIISLYHIVYSINKLLYSDFGITALFFVLIIIPTYLEIFHDYVDYGISSQFYYYFAFHVLVGVGSVFSDYLLADLEELTFFNFDSFWTFMVILSSCYFI